MEVRGITSERRLLKGLTNQAPPRLRLQERNLVVMSKSFHEQLAEAEELVVDTAGIVFHQRQRTLARPVLSQA